MSRGLGDVYKRQFLNRAFQGVYAPGSTFKMVTAVAGLESGIIEPDTEIMDTGVYTYYQDDGPQCWYWRQYRRKHGLVNVSEALEVSCNVFFFDVGRRVGIQGLQEFAAKFGLGEPTGIELYEETGVMAGPEYTQSMGQTWYEGSTLSVAIGQESTQVTPIQLATYAATLANNGTRYRTHFVKAILDTNTGEVLSETQPEVMDVIEGNGNTFALVRQGMTLVPSTISGKISSYPIAIACKTGTPQRSETYASGKHYLNAMMIAYLPADDPEIAIGITVEYGGYGARTGDLVVDIANAYFAMKDGTLEVDPYVDPRTVVQEDAAAADTAAQAAPDAANDAQTDATAAEPQQTAAPAAAAEEENNDVLLAQ